MVIELQQVAKLFVVVVVVVVDREAIAGVGE